MSVTVKSNAPIDYSTMATTFEASRANNAAAPALTKIFTAATKDFVLLLTLDVNKTIVATDASKKQTLVQVINSLLSESDKYTYIWGPELTYETSHRVYVDKHMKIEAKDAQERDQKRLFLREHFVDFVQALDETVRPDETRALKKKVVKDYKELMEAMRDQYVFPSVIHLLKQLRQDGITTHIFLRTFGTEGSQAAKDITRQLPDVQFPVEGYFEGGKLHLPDRVLSTAKEIYDYFKDAKCPNMVIQDSHAEWVAHNKAQEHSKLVPVDMNDPNTLSTIWDDNFEIDPRSRTNIIAPIDVATGAVLPTATVLEKKLVVATDTIEAIRNKTYFVDHIKSAMAAHVAKVATAQQSIAEQLNAPQDVVDEVISCL